MPPYCEKHNMYFTNGSCTGCRLDLPKKRDVRQELITAANKATFFLLRNGEDSTDEYECGVALRKALDNFVASKGD